LNEEGIEKVLLFGKLNSGRGIADLPEKKKLGA